MRDAEGDLLISLACDLLDAGGSSINREALSLVRGGLTMRVGPVARAPWEEALRRASIVIAGAILAIACGAAARGMRGELAYPVEGWLAVFAAPALVVVGQLTGRRVPIVCGAVLLLGLGLAQSTNPSLVPLGWGEIQWNLQGSGWQAAGQGATLQLFTYALACSLLLLASAAYRRRPVTRPAALATVAYVVVSATVVYLTLESTASLNPTGTVRFGDVAVNGFALCIVASSVAAVVLLAVRVARPQRDPAGMLAAALTVASILPVACWYLLGAAPLDEPQFLLAIAASATATVAATLKLARVSSTLPP